MMRLHVILPLSVLLTGCVTGNVAPDTVENANAHIAAVEQGKASTASEDEQRRLAHLFADRPEYVALVEREEEGAVLPRLRETMPPVYPLMAYAANAKATVRIAFVVAEDGTVEEARVYETSDTRFSTAALDSVRAWTFYPGRFRGAPAKFIFVVPIQFEGRS